jgi:hypothetical protein
MTTFTLRTVVMKLPPTPLGLLPERWRIEHQCDRCGLTVNSAGLLAHARSHDDGSGRSPGRHLPVGRLVSAVTDEQEGDTIE